MRYISLFSGIGGLEHRSIKPTHYAEIEPIAAGYLAKSGVEVISDVTKFSPPAAEAVVGGWPCQDISIAGKQAGLAGARSGLFYQLVRIAKESKANTIIGENVPNLLKLNGGQEKAKVEQTLQSEGFTHIEWRILNARQFGLPHHRSRVFVVASKDPKIARALQRPIGGQSQTVDSPKASGFYWTAGTQSICFSTGYLPTIKVGSGLSIPSPPAVFFDGVVRKVTAAECLSVQGFDSAAFADIKPQHIFRMAGNAVTKPVGHWVLDSLNGWDGDLDPTSPTLATNLDAFIDFNNRIPMSQRAASGLLRRLQKSQKKIPADLRAALVSIAGSPSAPTGITPICPTTPS